MKILHVGNGNQKHRGAKFYDVGTKISNGFIRAGHHVLFMSDRDITRALSVLKSKASGQRHCNRYFIECCINYKPDLIVLGHADFITPDSLIEAKKILKDVKILQWNVDPVFRPKNVANILSKADCVDMTFVTTAGETLAQFSGNDCKTAYIPNPIDPSIETLKQHQKTDQKHDVFWAMRFSKYHDDNDPRITYPLFLKDNGINIQHHGVTPKSEIFGADYFDAISNAKMGLNLSVNKNCKASPVAPNKDLFLYSSDRISHYMGNGLLTFTPNFNKIDEIFTADKEIITFENQHDLLEKVKYFQNNDEARQNIAKSGWEKSHEKLNATLVSQYMIEQTFKLEFTHDYIWPTKLY